VCVQPAWYAGWNNPYYKESHRKFRNAMREFVDESIAPFTHEVSGVVHLWILRHS
jgi:hypothetical protein